MSGPASDAGIIRREALVRDPESRSNERTLSRARSESSRFLLDFDWVENHAPSCRSSWRFDSVAKDSELPDHACRTALFGLFGYCWAAFLIPNPLMQNDPDQMAEAMRNHANSFVVSQARHEAMVHDLEDASLVFDSSIRSLIENPAHLAVALGRVSAMVYACTLFLSRACPYPRGHLLG